MKILGNLKELQFDREGAGLPMYKTIASGTDQLINVLH